MSSITVSRIMGNFGPFLLLLLKQTPLICQYFNKESRIDQFRYIKTQPKTKDLSTRLWGITTELVRFIPQSLMLRSIVLGWILIHKNWSISIFMKKLCKWSYWPGSDGFLQKECFRILSRNPDFGWTFQFPSAIETLVFVTKQTSHQDSG